MNDYCNGIAYATGYIAKEKHTQYLSIRNCDPWYADCIAKETGYVMYKANYLKKHRITDQWVVKVKNIKNLVSLSEVQNVSDFLRAYIEIHGVLDTSKRKNNKRGLRLRIYGNKNVIQYINHSLPAKEKKIQYVQNNIENKYIGKTCVIYYQNRIEIEDILNFLNGSPKNVRIWKQWEEVMEAYRATTAKKSNRTVPEFDGFIRRLEEYNHWCKEN